MALVRFFAPVETWLTDKKKKKIPESQNLSTEMI